MKTILTLILFSASLFSVKANVINPQHKQPYKVQFTLKALQMAATTACMQSKGFQILDTKSINKGSAYKVTYIHY